MEYLSGATFFKLLYSKEFNKLVYIFGEHHINEGCSNNLHPQIDIVDFMLKIMSGKAVDIFLEHEFHPHLKDAMFKREISGNSPLSRFQTLLLEKCYTEEKRKEDCPYKNAYFHFSDIRHNSRHFSILLYLQLIYESSIQNLSAFIDDIIELVREYQGYSGTLDFNSAESLKQQVSQALERLKVDKQMSNIPDKFKIVKDMLNSELENIFKLLPRITIKQFARFLEIFKTVSRLHPENIVDFHTQFSKLNPTDEDYLKNIKFILSQYKTIRKDKEEKHSLTSEQREHIKDIKNTLRHYFDGTGDIFLRIMDTYLLSRLFRTFKDGHEPKNIIILAGEDHSRYYYNFITRLGFKDIQKDNIAEYRMSNEEILSIYYTKYDPKYRQKYTGEKYEEKKGHMINNLMKQYRITPCIILKNFDIKYI